MADPSNIESIHRWIKANRPDVAPTFVWFLKEERAGNEQAQAILAFMLMGWSAGRHFQRENPDSDFPMGKY